MIPKRQIQGIILAGPACGFLSAILFALSTPVSKLLLAGCPPVLLAGLLYLGSGLALSGTVVIQRRRGAGREYVMARQDLPWLILSTISGGMIAPAILMLGLLKTAGSTAGLLLNFESVFTALIAWVVFKEHVDRGIAAGMMAIFLGGLTLSFESGAGYGLDPGCLLVTAACLGWAIDNNVTRKILTTSPMVVAGFKGAVAGPVNIALAVLLGTSMPDPSTIVIALATGAVSYGSSLVFFILALRSLGTARTAAYFGSSPFVAAILSVLILGESFSLKLLVAGILMLIGLCLHLSERHLHSHLHDAEMHDHSHRHDRHHTHEHEGESESATGSEGSHSHLHSHESLVHTHTHYPDTHHRHDH